MIYLQISIFTPSYQTFAPDQHGFVSKCSTVTNLCNFSRYTYIGSSRHSGPGGYCDMVKGSDRKNHRMLPLELRFFGFNNLF